MSSDDMTPSEGSRATVSRRSLLRKSAAVTAGGLAVAAASGGAAASTGEVRQVDGVTAGAVDDVLASAGDDLLATLSTAGLLAAPSTAALPTSKRVDIGAAAAGEPGRATVRGSDDVLRHVTVTRVEEGTLTVTVEPERGRAYAFLDRGDETLLYDPAAGFDGVAKSALGTTSDCSTNCNCKNVTCSDGRPLEECTTCCCHSDCGDCCCSTDYSCC